MPSEIPVPLSNFRPRPVQASLAPGPSQSLDQQQQKNQHRHERANRQFRKRNRERHEKDRFNIEYQEDNAINVVLRLELNTRFSGRLDAAFVGRIFIGAGLGWLKEVPPQPGEREGNERKDQGDTRKDDEEEIGRRGHEGND